MLRLAIFTWQTALGMVLWAGCGVQTTLLETDNEYFFTAGDCLVLPRQTAMLQAQFRAGDFFQPQAGHCVRFYRQGRLFKAALTDDMGQAAVAFTPDTRGDYFFQAAVSPLSLSQAPPEPTTLLVACRAAREPMIVVDLDKTIVASGFHTVLLGGAEPMPLAAEVLHDLAQSYTIVYLTHRPDVFGPKSKAWLKDHGFPTGPLLLSTLRTFVKGSREYKTMMLEDITARFSGVEIGIGDKISDVQAYHEHGMQAFLIMPIPADLTPVRRDSLVEQLQTLPDTIQVVQDWAQIAAVQIENQRYPAKRTIDLLLQQFLSAPKE